MNEHCVCVCVNAQNFLINICGLYWQGFPSTSSFVTTGLAESCCLCLFAIALADVHSKHLSRLADMESAITLWQFLLQLLLDQSHKHLICWTSNDGEFKLLKSEEVAKLWGLR